MQAMRFLRGLAAALVLAAGCAPQAGAVITTITGDTTGGPTWERPDEYPFNWGELSYPGTTYRLYDVEVREGGNPFNFAAVCAFDCSLYIYTGSFDPAHPTDNFLAANGNYVTYFTAAFGGPLDAGHYALVVTGEDSTTSGFYSLTASGPGAFTITDVTPVPEPAAWLMLAAGLGLVAAARRARRTSAAVHPATIDQ